MSSSQVQERVAAANPGDIFAQGRKISAQLGSLQLVLKENAPETEREAVHDAALDAEGKASMNGTQAQNGRNELNLSAMEEQLESHDIEAKISYRRVSDNSQLVEELCEKLEGIAASVETRWEDKLDQEEKHSIRAQIRELSAFIRYVEVSQLIKEMDAWEVPPMDYALPLVQQSHEDLIAR